MKTKLVHLLHGYLILIITTDIFPWHLLGSRGVRFILSGKVRLGAGNFFRIGAKILSDSSYKKVKVGGGRQMPSLSFPELTPLRKNSVNNSCETT